LDLNTSSTPSFSKAKRASQPRACLTYTCNYPSQRAAPSLCATRCGEAPAPLSEHPTKLDYVSDFHIADMEFVLANWMPSTVACRASRWAGGGRLMQCPE